MQALRAFAIAGSLVAASVSAQAASTDWDEHGAAELGSGFPVSGAVFGDSFEFELKNDTTLRAAAVSVNLPPAVQLVNGFVQLFRANPGADTMIGMFAFNGTTGNDSHTFASLVAGEYYYLVTGLANGTLGGGYLLTSSTVAAVPEPAQLSLLLAGLLATGYVIRRRRAA